MMLRAERAAAEYWARGYLVLRGAFPRAEAAVWRQECERLVGATDLVHPLNLRTRFRTLSSGEKDLDRIDPVADVSPLFRALARDERILAPVRAVLRDDAVPFKDKVMVKSPAITGYRLHQDYAYWQPTGAPPDALLSVLVAVDGARAETGALELFPRLHGHLLTPPGEIADPDERELDLSRGELVETEPGDVVLFHSLAPHRSRDNSTRETRFQLYVSYAAARYLDLLASFYEQYHQNVRAGLDAGAREGAFFR